MNNNVLKLMEPYAFGTLLLVKMVIQIVNPKQNVNNGHVKMLHLLIIMIHYVDNLKMNVQLIVLTMGVLKG